MAYVSVEVDADDVLRDLSDTELEDELRRRAGIAEGTPIVTDIERIPQLLDQVCREMRGRCPAALSEYLYITTGRIV